MAKVMGPLFSIAKGGTVGNAINYLRWRNCSGTPVYERANFGVVRIRGDVIFPRGLDQKAMNGVLSAAVSSWHDESVVPAESRHSWLYYSSPLSMNDVNRYIQKFIENNPQRSAPWNIPGPE